MAFQLIDLTVVNVAVLASWAYIHQVCDRPEPRLFEVGRKGSPKRASFNQQCNALTVATAKVDRPTSTPMLYPNPRIYPRAITWCA